MSVLVSTNDHTASRQRGQFKPGTTVWMGETLTSDGRTYVRVRSKAHVESCNDGVATLSGVTVFDEADIFDASGPAIINAVAE